MKAIVYHGIGDIRLEDVPEPKIQDPTDAVVRLTKSAICGTDLHMVRGTMSGMVPGTILGHEGVGVVEECGRNVRNMKKGDRVVIPSTVGCGYCSYCRAGYFAQCDNANPNGKRAGTVFFGEEDASATPVREAMLDLVAEGLVEVVRNKGFRVTSLSDSELREARATIARALEEDLRYGPDITTAATVPAMFSGALFMVLQYSEGSF